MIAVDWQAKYLSLHDAVPYVAAAYCIVFAVVLAYIVIIALKLQRLEREVDELAGRAPAEPDEDAEREPAPVG